METDSPGAPGCRRGTRAPGNGARPEIRQSGGRFLPIAAPRPCAQAGGSRQDPAKTSRHQGAAQKSGRKEKTGKAEEEGRAGIQGGASRCRSAADASENRASPHGAGKIGSGTNSEAETQSEEKISWDRL